MEGVKFLGSHALRNDKGGMSSLQVSRSCVIDAGNLMESLGEEVSHIDHIFLTHSHLDHLNDLPYLVDATFDARKHSLRVYGTAQTLRSVREHLFCREIWADFTAITLPGSDEPAVRLVEIEIGRRYEIDDIVLVPLPNRHIPGSCGFLIEGEGGSILYSSDTGVEPALTELLQRDTDIKAAVFELSFPDEKIDIAKISGHMTPALLSEQLEGLSREDLHLYVNHGKPVFRERMTRQMAASPILRRFDVRWIEDGDTILYATGERVPGERALPGEDFRELLKIAAQLGAEKDLKRLHREILLSARRFTHADGGTLYLLDKKGGRLLFHIVQNDTLGIDVVASEDERTGWPPIPLYREDGSPNLSMVAAKAALEGEIVMVDDIYRSDRYDFSGAREYDRLSGYRTVSMLVVPLKDHEGAVIAVLQLLNRKRGREVIPFGNEERETACSLATLAGVAMQNRLLIEGLEEMIVTFLQSLAKTLHARSPYTGRHIERVAELTMAIAEAVDESDAPPFASIHFDDDEMRQIHLAALVHDIGKIAISDLLIEKGTKLEGLCDRIELVRLRAEIVKSRKRADLLEEALKRSGGVPEEALRAWRSFAREVDETMRFLEVCNRPEPALTDESVRRIEAAAGYRYRIGDEERPLLEPDEVEALSVRYGSLTDEEREIIKSHIQETRRSLERLTFPEKFSRVPEIAGAHHEKLDGTGYPLGLEGDSIPLEARMLAIADIFEALTASDRPYKHPNPLSEAVRILREMARKGELDSRLVELFLDKGLHLTYARRHLKSEQIDME